MVTLVLMFLSCSVMSAADYEFEVERMGVDSLGVCHNDNVVIAYGTGGMILCSTDKGQEWKQKQIANDSVRIMEIVNIKGDFYGILFNGYLIKSTDDGNTWQTAKGTGNIPYKDMTYSEDSLFVLTKKNTIHVFNFDLELQNEIILSDSIFTSDMAYFNGSLYMQAWNSKIAVLDVNNNYKEKLIANLSTSSDWKVDEGWLYVSIGPGLYRSKDPASGWSKVADTVNIYNFYNHVVYDIHDKRKSEWFVSWPDFYRLDEHGRSKINTDSIQRFVVYVNIRQFEFLDENTIVAVGTNKTIYLSTNGGRNWTLKNNLNTFYTPSTTNINQKWVNGEIGYFSNAGQIFKTTDAGVTWLPQQFTDTLIKKIKYFDVLYIDSTGEGFAWSTDKSNILKDTTRNIMFVYTKDGGETFTNKWQQILSPSGIIYNWQKSIVPIEPVKINGVYVFTVCPTIEQSRKRYCTRIFIMDSDFNIINNIVLDSIYLMKIEKISENTLAALAWERRYPNESGSFDSSATWIVTSTDSGKTWNREFECYIKGTYPYTDIVDGRDWFVRSSEMFYVTDDSVVFNRYIYHVDLDAKKCRLLHMDSLVNAGESTTLICKFNDRLYFRNGTNFLMMNDYHDAKPELRNCNKLVNSNINMNILSNCWSGNEFIYSRLKQEINSLYSIYSFVKLTPVKDTTDVIEIPEVNFDYLWASPAYPNPADDYVKTRVYAYMDEEFDLNNFSVYDILGSKLSTDGKLSLMPLDNKSATLTWDCSGMNTGVYFIQIKIGSKSRTVPVIIAR